MHSPSLLPHPGLPKYYPRILPLGRGENKGFRASRCLPGKRGTWARLGGGLRSSLVGHWSQGQAKSLASHRHLHSRLAPWLVQKFRMRPTARFPSEQLVLSWLRSAGRVEGASGHLLLLLRPAPHCLFPELLCPPRGSSSRGKIRSFFRAVPFIVREGGSLPWSHHGPSSQLLLPLFSTCPNIS